MLIDKVKVALRTLTDDEGINNQIQSLIDACIVDLKSADIEVIIDNGECIDKNIELAIIIFVKAYFNSSDNEKFIGIYNTIKSHLSIVR